MRMEISMMVVLLAGVALMGPVRAADKASCAQGVCVKVRGQSGKIAVAPGDTEGEVDTSEDQVTINMDGLAEVAADGTVVGKTGSVKHTFNSFASQEFTFSEITAGDLQGVGANTFDFQAQLGGLSSTLKVSMYIFTEDGNITMGGETQMVQNGSVKFNIELSDWAFCSAGSCKKGQTDEVGEFVDFMLEIKGKGNATEAPSGDDSEGYDLGGNATLKLSTKVEIDGVWQDMEDGYPMYETQGPKQKFTFRFNKFTDKAFYDPTIVLGASLTSETPTPEPNPTPEPTQKVPPGDSSSTTMASALLLSAALLLVKSL